jgi:hypothetical protein
VHIDWFATVSPPKVYTGNCAAVTKAGPPLRVIVDSTVLFVVVGGVVIGVPLFGTAGPVDPPPPHPAKSAATSARASEMFFMRAACTPPMKSL